MSENQVRELKEILGKFADVVNSMIDPEEKQPTVSRICPEGHARVTMQLFYYCPMCMKLYPINAGSEWHPKTSCNKTRKEPEQ